MWVRHGLAFRRKFCISNHPSHHPSSCRLAERLSSGGAKASDTRSFGPRMCLQRSYTPAPDSAHHAGQTKVERHVREDNPAFSSLLYNMSIRIMKVS